jgi:hypothetical protein
MCSPIGHMFLFARRFYRYSMHQATALLLQPSLHSMQLYTGIYSYIVRLCILCMFCGFGPFGLSVDIWLARWLEDANEEEGLSSKENMFRAVVYIALSLSQVDCKIGSAFVVSDRFPF